MKVTRKLPLFIVTGASCVGKSSVCNELFMTEKDYIVMESDLLWSEHYDTPEDNYCEYRRMWMRVCANISQIGMPVVLCGCAVPEQFEHQPERELFSEIHYLAIVCEDKVMEQRMRKGRKVTDEAWIRSSRDFNLWLKEHAALTEPKITLLDTTELTIAEAAHILDGWIREKQREEGKA